MSGASVGPLVGLLVGVAAWCVLERGGRRAHLVAVHAGTGGGAPLGGDPQPRGWRPRVLQRRRGQGRGEPERVRLVVAQVGALVRAGASPGAAWERTLGVRPDTAGIPSVVDLAPHVGGRSTAHALVAACRLAVDVGAPLATVLDQVAASVAAEAEARAGREAALAGPRSTARVLLWLPVVGLVLGYALGADPVATAAGGGAGTTGIVLGVLLLLAGRSWSARLVGRARAAGEEA
ncbi:hypothetical protein IF650_03925 [Cellulosimicrobium terreum]|nr:hypothetical protein [Cellulosimicrobium terreum]